MGHFRTLSHQPSRRLILAGLAAVPAAARARPCAPVRVLFVCTAGTVKSAIAREALRDLVAAEGLPVEVSSRGLRVEDHVSPALAAKLRADRIDPAREEAQPLREGDLARADLVIAFDEAADAPGLSGARAWRTPSWNDDYAAARSDLATRLDALMDDLRRRAHDCR